MKKSSLTPLVLLAFFSISVPASFYGVALAVAPILTPTALIKSVPSNFNLWEFPTN